MTRTRLVLVLPSLAALLLVACRGDRNAPPTPTLGVATSTSTSARPARTGRCAMCGMDVATHPDWTGELELADGSVRYGCSVRCTLGMSMHARKFLGVEPSTLRSVRVPDYMHPGTLIAADAAFYVVDSDVRGAMGTELVPASSEADARAIVERHGGRVLRRAEITTELLRQLREHGKSSP